MTRKQCTARLRALARVRRDESEFGLLRGQCANKKCRNRYAVIRVTYDFRDAKEILSNAELVCAECDRVWSAKRMPRLTKNIQRVRIMLILRPEKRAYTYVNRGRVHRVGDDALIVADANYGLLETAREEWHQRNDRVLASRARAIAKRNAESEARERASREFIAAHEATWDARDAERRENGYVAA